MVEEDEASPVISVRFLPLPKGSGERNPRPACSPSSTRDATQDHERVCQREWSSVASSAPELPDAPPRPSLAISFSPASLLLSPPVSVFWTPMGFLLFVVYMDVHASEIGCEVEGRNC